MQTPTDSNVLFSDGGKANRSIKTLSTWWSAM